MRKVTFLNVHDSVKHSILVDAPTDIIAVRLGWDAFLMRRTHQRYPTPLKEDFALYSVVEIKETESGGECSVHEDNIGNRQVKGKAVRTPRTPRREPDNNTESH